METYTRKDQWNGFRLIVHRPDDKKSFLEAHQTDVGEKKNKFNLVTVDMSDSDLIELRDFLNRVVE